MYVDSRRSAQVEHQEQWKYVLHETRRADVHLTSGHQNQVHAVHIFAHDSSSIFHRLIFVVFDVLVLVVPESNNLSSS